MNKQRKNSFASGDYWIKADQVFCGDNLSSDKALHIMNGRVANVADNQNVPSGVAVKAFDG